MPAVIAERMEAAAREREAKEKGTTAADADSPLEAAVTAASNGTEAAAIVAEEERMI